MVGTKSHGYSNSGRLSEGKYSMPFFSTVTALILMMLKPMYYFRWEWGELPKAIPVKETQGEEKQPLDKGKVYTVFCRVYLYYLCNT